MPFHNPFIKNGRITFPDNGNVVRHVERWAKVRGDKLAYRFLDFSVERDGVDRDLNWADFSARNRAVGARLQQVTQPGDRVAILCPQNLDYLVAFFGTLYAGRIAVPAVRPVRAGPRRPAARRARRLRPVGDPDHHRLRRRCPQVLPQPSGQGTAPRHRRRRRSRTRSPPPGSPSTIDRDTIAYLQYTSGSTRIPTGVEITHLNLATNVVQVIEALEGEEGDRGVTWLPFFHDMGLITAHDRRR